MEFDFNVKKFVREAGTALSRVVQVVLSFFICCMHIIYHDMSLKPINILA